MNAPPLTGGCACGAVRYTAASAPLAMTNCHCRDCQRASGSAFSAFVVIPKDAVQVEGEVRYHAMTGESGGTIERGFCPACGSPIATRFARLPRMLGLMAGSLDDPSLYRPTLDVFTESAQAWLTLGLDTGKRPRGWA